MTTLEQLKGTDDLLNGFEIFLREWLSPVAPKRGGQKPNGDQACLFDLLPAPVRQFYEIVDRWPDSRIAEDHGQDRLITALRLEREWIPIIAENQCIFCIFASTYRDDCLFIPRWEDDTWNPIEFTDEELFPVETPISEFLVCFGLRELIFKSPTCEELEDNSLLNESRLIFTSTYEGAEENRFYYHPSGILWLDSESSGQWAAKRNSPAKGGGGGQAPTRSQST